MIRLGNWSCNESYVTFHYDGSPRNKNVLSPFSVCLQVALVYGQMNEPPGARARVALTGLTVAEYFRDQEGQDVLLFIDNIFRFTQAGSEVSGGFEPSIRGPSLMYSSTSLIRPPFIRISLLSGRDLAVIFFFVCTIITGKRGISNSIRIPTQTHMNYILFPT